MSQLNKLVRNHNGVSVLQYIGNEGSMFLFRTSEGTENNKIIRARVNLRLKKVDYSYTLVPEDPHRVLDWAVPLSR